MRRLLFATIMLLAFFACDEDEVVGWEDYVIWDISPIEFRILVLDENGNDLITDKENSDVLQGLKLWYNNECYLLEDGESVMVTRYYMPTFYPFQILPYPIAYNLYAEDVGNVENVLVLGEWDGSDNFDSEEVVLEWGDGSKDVFTFSNSVQHDKSELQITRNLYHNGEEIEGSYIKIYK